MSPSDSIQRVAVIMAGGSGERFWPLSRREHPKQLLKLTKPDQSMLAEAVARLTPLIDPDRQFVITGAHLVASIREAKVGVPDANILAEPYKRNTSGCLAYAAAHLLNRFGAPENVSMAVVTADHLIGNPDRFREAVERALAAAEAGNVLATHGIAPTRPETGYGYIEADAGAPVTEQDGLPVYRVAAFHEKPTREKAETFVDAGSYYWNSGMFFWRLSSFLSGLDAARPELADAIRAMADALRTDDAARVNDLFASLDDLSIDYALMEKAKNVVVVRADYPWDDVGAWTSLDRTREHDDHGNVCHGEPVVIDSTDCIVYNDVGADAMAVSVVGMHDVVVVVSRDGVLVIPKDRAQDVRDAVAELKARNAKQV